MLISRFQLNAILRAAGATAAVLPGIASGQISVPYEVFSGDVIDSTVAIDATTLSNSPTSVGPLLVYANGTSQGSSYTATLGDVIKAGKLATNAAGTAEIDSNAVTVSGVPNFDTGLIGGNVGVPASYSNGGLFLNAVFDGNGFQSTTAGKSAFNAGAGALSFASTAVGSTTATSTSATAFLGTSVDVGNVIWVDNGKFAVITAFIDRSNVTVSIGTALSVGTFYGWFLDSIQRDANGWPLQAATAAPVTIGLGSAYTQNGVTVPGCLPPSTSLPNGVYHCTLQSTGPTYTTLTGVSGGTVSNTVSAGGTTTFDLTVPVAATVILNFSNGFQLLDCPRDGSSTSVGKPKFYTAALAHYSQFKTLRWMDFMRTNGNAARALTDRPPQFATYVSRIYTWELLADFIIALMSYAGSKFTQPWVNLPCFASPAYAAWIAQLFVTKGVSGVEFAENGNENWNSGLQQYGPIMQLAVAEAQVIVNYGVTGMVSSFASDGTSPNSTITVTTVAPISSYPFIAVSAPLAAANASNAIWNSIANATVQSVGANTFTYLAAGVVAPAAVLTAHPGVAQSSADQWAAYFNLASNLLGDWTPANPASYSVFNLVYKWYTRQTYLQQQAWKTYRPSARFIVNIAPYGSVVPPGSPGQPVHLAYGEYLGNTFFGTGHLPSWLYGAAMALYITAASNSTTDAVFNQLGYETSPGVFSGFMASISNAATTHVSVSKKWGLVPMCYEGSPDLQNVPALQYECNTDSRMGDLVVALVNAWLYAGGGPINLYSITPGYYQDGQSQGAWPYLNFFGDTGVTAVKLTRVLGYARPRSYKPTGAVDVAGLSNYLMAAGRWFLNATSGMVFWTAPLAAFTPAPLVEWVHRVDRSGWYAITLHGSDSVVGTVVALAVDGVSAGSQILPHNGAAQSTSTVAGASASPSLRVFLTAGSHNFAFTTTAPSTNSPGISTFDCLPA